MTPASILISRADLAKLAPNARPEYLEALFDGMEHLRSAGILDSELRWCHFIAQCCHETGGFTVLRESLTYTTAKRLREVWPARFRDKSDAELAPLLRNPVELGDRVYGGRMGNDSPGDGYAYRGGGFLQTTGKWAVGEYAKALGLAANAGLLDDCETTLRFACHEWLASGCNELADANDLIGVSREINVGTASSSVTPVGLSGRQDWFAKAWGIWGEKGKPDKPAAKPMTTKEAVVKIGTPTIAAGELVRQGVEAIKVPPVAKEALDSVSAWRALGKGFWGLGTEVVGVFTMIGRLWPYAMVAAGAGGVLAFLAWRKRGEVN